MRLVKSEPKTTEEIKLAEKNAGKPKGRGQTIKKIKGVHCKQGKEKKS